MGVALIGRLTSQATKAGGAVRLALKTGGRFIMVKSSKAAAAAAAACKTLLPSQTAPGAYTMKGPRGGVTSYYPKFKLKSGVL
jgi:hypothetical protein